MPSRLQAYGALYAALLAFSFGFVGYQVRSWRRSAGERRQQVKWLASGAVVTIVSAIIALSVSMGVGIQRYRLYEIDRLISRTLAYAAVTALLVGVYADLVLLSTHVL